MNDRAYNLQNTFPIRQDIVIRQGSIFQSIPLWMVKWPDNSTVPMNLTGYTARMQVRTNPGTDVIAEYSTANARIILPVEGASQVAEWESTGIFTFADSTKKWNIWIRVPATDTVSLPAGIYDYDLELVPPGNPGGAFDLYAGKCRVEAEVTR